MCRGLSTRGAIVVEIQVEGVLPHEESTAFLLQPCSLVWVPPKFLPWIREALVVALKGVPPYGVLPSERGGYRYLVPVPKMERGRGGKGTVSPVGSSCQWVQLVQLVQWVPCASWSSGSRWSSWFSWPRWSYWGSRGRVQMVQLVQSGFEIPVLIVGSTGIVLYGP